MASFLWLFKNVSLMFIYYNSIAFKLYVPMFNGNIVFIKKGSTKESDKSNLI
ncbi:hypothetical protein KTC97_16700 [Clostridium estertheticum]|uniref:hypothetical protein n=1 Tax=Clostridium estertheticum TaxID=238834 RepID=UPI0027156042|nr:hypothetical protein [Clostridium estertheticum]WLC83681.1 hypothetical protein KTC97_16700 [Clostridium estertheticum]